MIRFLISNQRGAIMIIPRIEDILILRKYTAKAINVFGRIIKIFNPEIEKEEVLEIFPEFIISITEGVKYATLNELEYDLIQEQVKALQVLDINIGDTQKITNSSIDIQIFCQFYAWIEKYLNNLLMPIIRKLTLDSTTEKSSTSQNRLIDDENEDDEEDEIISRQTYFIPIQNLSFDTSNEIDSSYIQFYDKLKIYFETIAQKIENEEPYDETFIRQFYKSFGEFNFALPSELLNPPAHKENTIKITSI